MALLVARLRLWWSGALWVIPCVGVVVAWFVASAVERLDEQIRTLTSGQLSPSAAQTFLAAVGGGMVTFTGFVFSVVLLMLQFGSSTYSPRTVSYVLQRRTTQWVLAVFLGTITFSFTELITIGSGGREDFVPVFSVAVALVALLASLFGFLALIHAVSGQLRVDALLSSIGRAARTRLRRRPRAGGTPASAPVATERPSGARVVRYAGEPGQLVEVAVTALQRIARASGARITLLVRVGDGVSTGASVAHVVGPAPSDRALSRCLLVRTERSLAHDPLYALRLLADVGLRALSPGINDPTTAVRALDEIEDVLRTGAPLPLGTVRHAAGEGSVDLPGPSWTDIVDLALLEILEAGIHAPQVTRRLMALLADLLADLPEQAHAPLLHHRRRLTDAVGATVSAEDRPLWLTGDRQGIGGSR